MPGSDFYRNPNSIYRASNHVQILEFNELHQILCLLRYDELEKEQGGYLSIWAKVL